MDVLSSILVVIVWIVIGVVAAGLGWFLAAGVLKISVRRNAATPPTAGTPRSRSS